MSADNVATLKLILDTYSIPIAEVGKITNKSRSYASRLLNGDKVLTGSRDFWVRLEAGLGKLIERRQSQVFAIPGIEPSKLKGLLKTK